MTAFDVTAAADMCVDLILAGNVRPQFRQAEQIIGDYSVEIGGSANIFACQTAKLGARTGVIGRVGPDLFGDFLLGALRAAGVDTSGVYSDATIRTGLGVSLTEPDDRAILTFPGGIGAVGPEDLPESPEMTTRHWHIASFFLLERLRPAWGVFLQRCRSGGVTVSLDPNWDPEARWEGVRELLPLTDVFLPNEAEALAISGETDAIAAGRVLSAFGPLVVIKRGERGAIAVRGDSVWQVTPTVSGAAVVDTVGAGDNFDAGFLCAWLSGLDTESALNLGHRCALASLATAGGIRGQLQERSFVSSESADALRRGNAGAMWAARPTGAQAARPAAEGQSDEIA